MLLIHFSHPALYPILFYLVENFIIILTLSFTPAASILRPALLPILILTAYPVVLHCPTVISRSAWAGFVGGNIITTLFHYVETALISKWDFDHNGPTHFPGSAREPTSPRQAPKSENPSKSKTESRLLERLKFGYFVATSNRNINTPYIVKNTPPFSSQNPAYIPSRTRFCLSKLATIAATFLFIDTLESSTPPSTPDQNRIRYSADAVHILTGPRRANLAPAAIRDRLVVVTLYWFCTAIVIDAFANFFALLFVALHIKHPRHYRPNFGPVTEAYTLRRFWGLFWHQHLRKQLSAPADLVVCQWLGMRKRGLPARYAHLALVFLLSGLLHTWVEVGQGYAWRGSGQLHFFTTQVVGIVGEDAVQAVWRWWCGVRRGGETTRGRRAVGFLWVVVFLWWATPAWFYPRLMLGKGDDRERLLGFGVVGWLKGWLMG